MLRTSCEGLVLNHPPLVVAVVGEHISIPKKGDAPIVDGECYARLPQKTKDAPPSILILLSEDIVEDVLQRPPLKEGCAVGAEPVVNIHEGIREGGGAELVGQLEERGVVGSDGIVVIDNGHSSPFLLLSQGSLCYILLLPRPME